MRSAYAPKLVAAAMLSLLVAPRVHAEPCSDDRLSEAALAILETHGDLPVARLEDLVRDARSNAVGLRMVRAASGSPELASLLTDATAREGAIAVCGEAEADGVVVRIVGREGARIRVSLGDQGLAIDIVPVRGLGRATLVVRAIEGTSFTRDLGARDARLVLPSDFPEAFVAQVLATDASGPRPVAEACFGAVRPPDATEIASETPSAHVARLRRMVSAPSLRANHVLDAAAAAHAAAVCTEGRAVHELDGIGPIERLRRLGVEARTVGEVVARASSRAESLASFDASPSHRLALEDAQYTDAGFGEATSEDGHVCSVVVLAAWPRFAGR